MSWTLDIIIALIIGLTIYFAAKNGFVKTAISALSFIVAIALTAAFSEPLAEYIKGTPIAQTVETATEEQITDILLNGSHEIDELIEGASEDFNTFISVTGLDKEELSAWYSENVVDEEKAESLLAQKIAEPIINTVAMIISILVIYVGSQIVLSVLAFLLDHVARLPVLKSCNKLLGMIIGAVLALVRVCLFCFVVKILIENSAFLGSDFISNLKPENTLLFKFFSEIDIYSFFL